MYFFIKYISYELKTSYLNGNNFIITTFFYFMFNAFVSFFLKGYIWIDIILPLTFLWISMLITYLLSFDRYFSTTLEREQLNFYYTYLLSFTVRMVFFIKIVVHWIIYGSSISICSFFISQFFYDFNYIQSVQIFLIFILYTFSSSLIGFLVFSICYRLKYKSSILSILLFPLYIPLTLFGITTFFSMDSFINYFQIWFGLNLILVIITMWLSYYAFLYSME